MTARSREEATRVDKAESEIRTRQTDDEIVSRLAQMAVHENGSNHRQVANQSNAITTYFSRSINAATTRRPNTLPDTLPF